MRLSLLLLAASLVFVVCAAMAAGETGVIPSASPPTAEELDYCCCTTTDVNENSEDVRSLLDSIVRRPFFRYFRVNTHKQCPYWAVNVLCTSEGNPCEVCTCDAKDVPFKLRSEGDMGTPARDLAVTQDSEMLDRNMFSTASLERKTVLPPQWGSGPDAGFTADPKSVVGGRVGGPHEAFTSIFAASDPDAEFVDLLRNPEGNTGYVGEMANRIWEAIYSENCFQQAPPSDTESNVASECAEESVFYRLISGLHTSISAHIAASFYLNEDSNTVSLGPDGKPLRKFLPECREMSRRVHDHPDRRKNLYILYQFVLRAMAKVDSQFIGDLTIYDTENKEEDSRLKQEMQLLFTRKLLCQKTFDDVRFLESPTGRSLIPSMKRMMSNITTLMDCLTCEKCRLWGKLQTHGVTTALKIITAPEGVSVPLRRAEMIALVNLARQLATSVHYIRNVCPDPHVDEVEGLRPLKEAHAPIFNDEL